jgi:hypothetical protein
MKNKDNLLISAPKVLRNLLKGEIYVPFLSSDLSFHDPDTLDDEIIYTITVHLKPSDGFLENKNFPLQPFTHFTQADVKNKKIIYHPPKLDVGKEEREVAFRFTGIIYIP